MKINLNDEQKKKLYKFQTLLKNQNNRCTRNPIYYIVDKQKITAPDHTNDGFLWILDSEEIADNDEDLITYINDNYDKNITAEDLEYQDEIEIGNSTFQKWYYQIIEKVNGGNCFSIFETDAIDHLESNNYHYSKGYTFAGSIWRAPIMEELLELLLNLEIDIKYDISITHDVYKKIGHTLGIDIETNKASKSKKDKRLPKEFYRNYYCAGEKDIKDFENALKKGYLKTWNQFDNIYYAVTVKGIEMFRKFYWSYLED